MFEWRLNIETFGKDCKSICWLILKFHNYYLAVLGCSLLLLMMSTTFFVTILTTVFIIFVTVNEYRKLMRFIETVNQHLNNVQNSIREIIEYNRRTDWERGTVTEDLPTGNGDSGTAPLPRDPAALGSFDGDNPYLENLLLK